MKRLDDSLTPAPLQSCDAPPNLPLWTDQLELVFNVDGELVAVRLTTSGQPPATSGQPPELRG